MLASFRPIAALLLSYGFLTTASAMFSSLLALRSQSEAFGLETLGFMTAAHSAGILVGARRSPSVISRVGHIRAFAAFASLVSVIALIHLLWIDPMAWTVLRFANGYLMAGMFAVTESWLNGHASSSTRGRILALYMITNYAGAGGGQLLIPTSSPDTFVLFCLASILFSMALIPVLLSRFPAPEPEQSDRLPLKEVFKISPLGFFGAFCAGMIAAPLWGLGTIFGNGIGLGLGTTALFMAITLSSGMFLQIPVGILSDRIGRKKVISAVAVISSFGAIALFFNLELLNEAGVLATGAFWGATTLTLYALCVAHTNDLAPKGKSVEVATAILFVYGIGAILGPILASFTMNLSGPSGLFAYEFAVTLVLSLVAIWRLGTQRRKVDRKQFIPVGTTGMMSEELLAKAQRKAEQVSERTKT